MFQEYRGFSIGPVRLGVSSTQWYAEVITPTGHWMDGLGYPNFDFSTHQEYHLIFAHCHSRRRAEKKIKRKIDKIIRKYR